MENYKHGMELKELIEKGETQNLEFKESLRLKDEIGETISAFSNSDGGTVIVGVSDSSSELRKLAKESGGRVYWDEQICEDASLDDISEEKIRQFLRKAKYERRLEIDPDILVKEALERFLSHIKKAAKIVGFERLEVWEYPINALREAIVNAICHRDYGYSSDITIGVFDDRVEISNPGTLPEPLTPEDLKKKHKSIPRNPLVANAFFLIRNIEQWGEGTNKIVKWCLEHGLREPDFEEIAGGFLVRFYAPEDILSLIPEPGKIDLEKLGLNERQIKALGLMVNEQEKFTIKEYSETFKVSKKTAIRDFKELIETGFVVKVGVKKGAYYVAMEYVSKK